VKGLVRRPEAALFALALGAYAYFYQAGGWNQNARFDLVRAIVERGTLTIDDYESNTGDKAQRGGRLYSDKAPGVSLTALPAYAALHAVAGPRRETDRFQAGASYLCTVLAVALPSAVAVGALFVLTTEVLGLGPAAAAAVALAYAFGTLAFPYSTLLYGHQPAAALAFVAFALLAQARHRAADPAGAGRLLLAGLALGWAVVVEYPAALSAGAVGLYAIAFVRPRLRLAWTAAGAAAALAVLFAYHTAAFGGPFELPYSFSVQQPRHRGAFMGLGWPSLRVLRYLLVDEYRGLFYGSPWLLLAFPGAFTLMRHPRLRPEAVVCVSVALLYVLLNASLTDWHGGWGMGPRHLVAALPFLAVLAAGVAVGRAVRPAVAAAGGVAACIAVFLMLAGTAVKPEVPRVIERPFHAYLLPAFFEGRLAINTQSIDMTTGKGHAQRRAWNLGELLGLEGLATLVPLAVYAAACAAWLGAAARARRLTGPGPPPPAGTSPRSSSPPRLPAG
jgi:hypothetical protein